MDNGRETPMLNKSPFSRYLNKRVGDFFSRSDVNGKGTRAKIPLLPLFFHFFFFPLIGLSRPGEYVYAVNNAFTVGTRKRKSIQPGNM